MSPLWQAMLMMLRGPYRSAEQATTSWPAAETSVRSCKLGTGRRSPCPRLISLIHKHRQGTAMTAARESDASVVVHNLYRHEVGRHRPPAPYGRAPLQQTSWSDVDPNWISHRRRRAALRSRDGQALRQTTWCFAGMSDTR